MLNIRSRRAKEMKLTRRQLKRLIEQELKLTDDQLGQIKDKEEEKIRESHNIYL